MDWRLTVLTCNIDSVEPSAHEEYRTQIAPVHEVNRQVAFAPQMTCQFELEVEREATLPKTRARKFVTRVNTLPLGLMRSSRTPCTTATSNIRHFHWSPFYCLMSVTSDTLPPLFSSQFPLNCIRQRQPRKLATGLASRSARALEFVQVRPSFGKRIFIAEEWRKLNAAQQRRSCVVFVNLLGLKRRDNVEFVKSETKGLSHLKQQFHYEVSFDIVR